MRSGICVCCYGSYLRMNGYVHHSCSLPLCLLTTGVAFCQLRSAVFGIRTTFSSLRCCTVIFRRLHSQLQTVLLVLFDPSRCNRKVLGFTNGLELMLATATLSLSEAFLHTMYLARAVACKPAPYTIHQ